MTMSTPKVTVLVIDDEVQIRRLLRITLEAAGITVIDAVVLDLGLPDLPGLEVLKRLREWSRVPVLILTVVAGESDKVAALDAGADDYLTKPFGSAELTARLRAILRRVIDENEPTVVTFGNIEVDLAARVVRRSGAEVRLTAKEYAMVRLLVMHRGKVVTHVQMLRELWGPNSEDNTHYLRVHMTHIRQKLEEEPHHPRHLKTESGIGYRLVED
jgi:two-component system KDP operon response regulator KdpE